MPSDTNTDTTEIETHSLFEALEAVDDDEIDEITIDIGDDVEMPAEEFRDRFRTVTEIGETLQRIQMDLHAIREQGLTDSDARDLLFGRNHSLTKAEIEETFDAIDAIRNGRADRPLVRLVAALSDGTLAETEQVLDELETLADRYGDPDDE